MLKSEMDNLVTKIQDKLGKDTSALIGDDLGILLSDNSKVNSEIENRDKIIEKLKQDKENLILSNGNLLQQVSMGEDVIVKSKEKEEVKNYSFKTAFDEKGRFKK